MALDFLIGRPTLVTLMVSTRGQMDGITAPPTEGLPLVLDCSLSENYTGEASVTKWPVEKGFDIADSVQTHPRGLRLEGVVSDSPLPLQTLSVDAIVSGLTSSALATTFGAAPRSQQAYELLETLRTKRIIFDLQTGLTVLGPCIATSVGVTRDKNTGRALRFSMAVEEIRIINTDAVGDDLGAASGIASAVPVPPGT